MDLNKLNLEKYTLEAFDTTEPYKDLELITDQFLKQAEEQRLEEHAKSLGYKNFKKMLAAYRKELRSIENASFVTLGVTGVTDFDGQEAELKIASWNADETGIWRKGRDGLREYACSHPIYPCQLRTNIDTGETKVKLRFKRGGLGYWTTQVVDYDIIANAKNIVSLAKIGVSVTSGSRAQALVDYLREITDMNYDFIERVKTVSYLGWNSEGFAPYNGDVEFDGDPNFQNCFNAIAKPKGDLEAWISEFCKCREYSVVCRIVTAASFASALIKPLGIQPFFVHLWGMDSGTGKSVAQMVAASIWGDPEINSNKYFTKFDATNTATEFLAGFLQSIPIFIDELQLAKDKNGKVVFNVYSLASGSGRRRGTKNLGLATVRSWNNCFITSGETPIVGSQDGAGALNRVIEIECKANNTVVDLTDDGGRKTANLFRENYGFAGRLFVKLLLKEENMEKAKSMYARFHEECVKDNATGKQAMAAAAILTADSLAEEWFFGDEPLSVKDMSEFLKSNEAVSASARGYDYMCDWVGMNYNKFTTADVPVIEKGEIFGTISGSYAYIIRSVFDQACTDAGINSKALLSHLKSKGLLYTRGDGKGYTTLKVVTANAPKIACVGMKIQDNGLSDTETFDSDAYNF